ncbi:MAG: hypothetical protein GW858_06980 [Sphingomonadales bacterium]|nr:hypothetical protein [Sphingomonadales bacterium]NCQ21647.1 hypothetical protein [Sphingomonadales bacterium]NCT04638.1 hypothetical protein [Sphingomonadales bacterium]
MKKLSFAGLMLSASLASPAVALEHEVVIDHASGPIAADYKGSVAVETRQVGSAGVAGRSSTLRCNWTASLKVERIATVGDTMQSRRVLTRNDVASGSRPGWCQTQTKAIDRLVETRRERIRTVMLAVIEQDRAELVAEAESALDIRRDG